MTMEKESTKRLKLVWCSPHPTHYNSYLFDHLAEMNAIAFEAVYFYKGLAKYPWKSRIITTYPVRYLSKFFKIDWNFIREKIRAKDELLVLAGWNEPTMLLLMLYFSLVGRRFVLYSDTPELHVRYGLKRWVRKRILHFIFKRVYRFLVTGRPGVKHAQLIGVPKEKIINFPFATNIDFFIPAESKGHSSKKIKFISSGRLDHAHKAYDLAIEAFVLLKKENPSFEFEYAIAGTGPDREKLSLLIHQRGLEDQIHLLGWLEPSSLLVFYQSGDVFLHPSNFDPFPNAVLEAMSCGLPIIGSDAAGSVVDRVIEGENGYIHCAKNVHDLYEKIVLVCQKTEQERMLMGKASRKVADQWAVAYHVGIIEVLIQDYITRR